MQAAPASQPSAPQTTTTSRQVAYLPMEVAGLRVVIKMSDNNWLVTNDHLKSATTSLAYRSSKNNDDRMDCLGPTWGSMIQGFDEGDGWLRCGPQAAATSTVPAASAPAPYTPQAAPAPAYSAPPRELEHPSVGSGDLMVIDVPAGVLPGQVIAIAVPDGRQIEVTVPAGKRGGDQLELLFDLAAGTLTPKTPGQIGTASDQLMVIQVPPGVVPGQVIGIAVPDGRQINATVPHNKRGGDQLELWFDAAAGTLSPLP